MPMDLTPPRENWHDHWEKTKRKGRAEGIFCPQFPQLDNPRKLSSLTFLFKPVPITAYFGILQRQTLHKHKDDYQCWKSHIAKSRENKFQQNPQQSYHLSGGCGLLGFLQLNIQAAEISSSLAAVVL